MPVIIDYILKLSICLAVVYLFYQLFLRRLTFYNWNRWYLLGYSALAFIIPLIDIMPELQRKELDQSAFVQLIPSMNFLTPADNPSLLETLTVWDWITVAAVLGSAILLIRFAIMYVSFLRIKKRAQLISNDATKIYQLDEDIRPFSFGNAIFINTELHSGEELEEIIGHEFVHVKQKHTIDIVWSEFLCIVLWFNPFVWLLRKAIKQNLEFVADRKVLQNGIDKKEYQYLLLKVMGNKEFAFATHFNFSSLKNRIAMMNSLKSAKVQLGKFLFLLPVVAILLLSFRKEVMRADEKGEANVALSKEDESIFKKAMDMAGNSPKPIWIVDGIPVALSLISAAYFDKDEVAGPNDFKVWFDGEIMTMEEANQKADRAKLTGVGAAPRAAALKSFGINSNLLLLASTKAMAERMRGKEPLKKDTIPQVIIIGKDRVDSARYGSGNSIVIRPASRENEKPLIVVDGVRLNNGEGLEQMDPSSIESISVLKGASAKTEYGEEGENGVIIVTTKGHKTSNIQVERVSVATPIGENEQLKKAFSLEGKVRGVKMENATSTFSHLPVQGKMTGLRIKINDNPEKNRQLFNGVYIVDGKEVNSSKISVLKPESIKTINVYKSNSEKEQQYGEKAKNGVIEIETKKPGDEVVVTGYGVGKSSAGNSVPTKLEPVIVKGYRSTNVPSSGENNIVFKGTVKGVVHGGSNKGGENQVMVFTAKNGKVTASTGGDTIIADTIFVNQNRLPAKKNTSN